MVDVTHGGDTFTFNHRQFCMFAREIIRLRAVHLPGTNNNPGRVGQCYGRALRDASIELRRQNLQFEELASWREPNIFTNGFAHLEPAEVSYLLLSLQHKWLIGLEQEDIRTAAEVAQQRRGRDPSANGTLDPQGFAELFHLPTSGDHQVALRRHQGRYLILQANRASLKLFVSYMTVTQERGETFPAAFVTTTRPSDNGAPAEVYQGVLHVAPAVDGVFFATGRHTTTGELRLTILEPRAKPVYDSEEMPEDLIGLRLSLQGGHAAGYHVWCSKLQTQMPEGTLVAVAREYALTRTESQHGKFIRIANDGGFADEHGRQPQDWFEHAIAGFREILAYLDDKQSVTLG